MTSFELSSLIIAGATFVLTVVILYRDGKRRKYDNLHMCFQRIRQVIDDNNQIHEAIPHHINSKQEEVKYRRKLDLEIEFACYLIVKKQIAIDQFFDMYGTTLARDECSWRLPEFHMRAQFNPYTVKVLNMCKKKQLLPLKENGALLDLKKEVADFQNCNQQTSPDESLR
jgi:hypothetical protein